eukprot:Skav201178  [mRNA]  locus=scaffold2736:22384:23967:+ [translate_table: standard]
MIISFCAGGPTSGRWTLALIALHRRAAFAQKGARPTLSTGFPCRREGAQGRLCCFLGRHSIPEALKSRSSEETVRRKGRDKKKF